MTKQLFFSQEQNSINNKLLSLWRGAKKNIRIIAEDYSCLLIMLCKKVPVQNFTQPTF